jgi:hypothetical protein
MSSIALVQRFGLSNFSFPRADVSNNLPNPIVNTIVEFPSYLIALFGGQIPIYRMNGTNFSSGIGWLEYSLPSATGALISIALFGIVFASIQFQTRRTVLANSFGWVALIGLTLISLAVSAFDPVGAIQPRYFFPLTLALIGLSLLTDMSIHRIPTAPQALILSAFVLTGSLLAWLRTSAFYSIGPLSSYTNFGLGVKWWRDEIPSRENLFAVLVIASLALYISLFWKNKSEIS